MNFGLFDERKLRLEKLWNFLQGHSFPWAAYHLRSKRGIS